jgi:hypothetical protein
MMLYLVVGSIIEHIQIIGAIIGTFPRSGGSIMGVGREE